MNKKHKIAIVGAGGIGRAVALILAEWSKVTPTIFIGDAFEEAANSAGEWLEAGLTRPANIQSFLMPMEGINEAMKGIFDQADILLDCLPGSLAPRMASYALEYDMHYANLTEYVQETNEIIAMSEGASTGFVLQTGLAPGFINILAHGLYQDFVAQTGNEQIEYLGMKVGALTQHAVAPHFYGFTWSPVGVATEYIKQAEVVRNYKKVKHASLADRETMIIDGRPYEADLTSGGAADLPQALAGKVTNLDYKTLRYPGHYAWVDSIVGQLTSDDQKIEELQAAMESVVPRYEDDLVVIHANVIGKEGKMLRTLEKAFHIYPQQVGKHRLRAIQTTTAAPLAEAARILLEGQHQGVVFQSQIDRDDFMNGRFVSAVYGD